MKFLKRLIHIAALLMVGLPLQNCTVVQYKPLPGPSNSGGYDSYPDVADDSGGGFDNEGWYDSDNKTAGRESYGSANSPADNFYAPVSTGLSGDFGAIRYEDMIRQKARRYSIDHYLMLAIVQAESRGNTMAVSSANCRGLTQLHINTARDYDPAVSLNDLHNPEINLEIASRHMARLRSLVHEHFQGADLMTRVELLAAAWNAGWSRVKQTRGVPNIGETRRFTQRVSEYYRLMRWGNS